MILCIVSTLIYNNLEALTNQESIRVKSRINVRDTDD